MWRLILGILIIGALWFYACVVCGARADRRLKRMNMENTPPE